MKRSKVALCVCPAVAPGVPEHIAVKRSAEQAVFVLNTGRFVPLSGARVIWHGPLVEARLQPTAPDTGDVPLWGGGPSTGKETWAGCGWCGSVRFCGLCTRPHLSTKKTATKAAFRMR